MIRNTLAALAIAVIPASGFADARLQCLQDYHDAHDEYAAKSMETAGKFLAMASDAQDLGDLWLSTNDAGADLKKVQEDMNDTKQGLMTIASGLKDHTEATRKWGEATNRFTACMKAASS